MNLRIPGPTPLPPEVLAAMSQQMIDHRGPEYEALHGQVVEWLKIFFETQNEIFILTSSGTGGMEAAIVNTLSPGDRVLAVNIGVFGRRFGTIAERYGAEVTWLNVPMGQAANPKILGEMVAEQGPFAAVLITHNETSTGVTNPLAALCEAIHQAANPTPLIIVDAISSVGAIPLRQDALGIDVVVAGSQKAWMAPPGLAFISFNARAWEAYEKARCPRFYFDLGEARRYARRNQTPATPNITAMYALRVSLEAMVKEGPEAIYARHERIGAYCRQLAVETGLNLYAAEGFRSNTVTALTLPGGLDPKQMLETLRTRYGIVCATGRDPSVEMIRIGHMGYVSEQDIAEVFAAMREIMAEMMG